MHAVSLWSSVIVLLLLGGACARSHVRSHSPEAPRPRPDVGPVQRPADAGPPLHERPIAAEASLELLAERGWILATGRGDGVDLDILGFGPLRAPGSDWTVEPADELLAFGRDDFGSLRIVPARSPTQARWGLLATEDLDNFVQAFAHAEDKILFGWGSDMSLGELSPEGGFVSALPRHTGPQLLVQGLERVVASAIYPDALLLLLHSAEPIEQVLGVAALEPARTVLLVATPQGTPLRAWGISDDAAAPQGTRFARSGSDIWMLAQGTTFQADEAPSEEEPAFVIRLSLESGPVMARPVPRSVLQGEWDVSSEGLVFAEPLTDQDIAYPPTELALLRPDGRLARRSLGEARIRGVSATPQGFLVAAESARHGSEGTLGAGHYLLRFDMDLDFEEIVASEPLSNISSSVLEPWPNGFTYELYNAQRGWIVELDEQGRARREFRAPAAVDEDVVDTFMHDGVFYTLTSQHETGRYSIHRLDAELRETVLPVATSDDDACYGICSMTVTSSGIGVVVTFADYLEVGDLVIDDLGPDSHRVNDEAWVYHHAYIRVPNAP